MEAIKQWLIDNEEMLWSTGEQFLIALVIFFVGLKILSGFQIGWGQTKSLTKY